MVGGNETSRWDDSVKKLIPFLLLIFSGCVSARTYVKDVEYEYHRGRMDAIQTSEKLCAVAKDLDNCKWSLEGLDDMERIWIKGNK